MKQNHNKRQLILRNCATDFWRDEILDEAGKYTDVYFQTIRDGGYTAVWIFGKLRDLVRFEEAPHWDNRNAERVALLNEIIERGKKHGVGVYLYVNEPRGFFEGEPLFEKYPDLQGPYNAFSQEPAMKGVEPEYSFCTKSTFKDIPQSRHYSIVVYLDHAPNTVTINGENISDTKWNDERKTLMVEWQQTAEVNALHLQMILS